MKHSATISTDKLCNVVARWLNGMGHMSDLVAQDTVEVSYEGDDITFTWESNDGDDT